MRLIRRQSLEVLSISALDIFASALGVFILMAIIMFPYYLKQPSLEVDLAGAEAELAAAAKSRTEADEAIEIAEDDKAAEEARLAEALERLQRAQAAAAVAQADVPTVEEPKTSEQDVPLSIQDLDLVFIMDATGSMGRELADLQANLIGVIRVLHRLAASLRVGFVAFKDRGDDYLTRSFPLEPMEGANVGAIIRFVQLLYAKGGGDDPEPVDEALAVAIAMPWRSDAQGRIIVIGDAPVHARNRRKTLGLAEQFRRSAPDEAAPRSVSAIFTGNSPANAAFFQALAQSGDGDFSIHQGQMIESVLLSVLPDPGGTGE